MRRLLLATIAAGLLAANIGCFIPIYSADPARRAQQLIFTSENLRSSSTNGSGSGSWINPAT